jgi:transcriptional regulator with XRE-family HTH domain
MKPGTLITLLREEISSLGITHKSIADALNYTPSYVNRMLRNEKMSTEIFENIMGAAGVTLMDLARRDQAEGLKSEDFGHRFDAVEAYITTLKEETLPARVAKLEELVASLLPKKSQ